MRHRLLNHNKFYYMKKESLRVAQQVRLSAYKHKKKKEFVVDANRLQIDEYMLGQIKKSKHSIKKLKQEVVDLKKEVKKLHDCREDYLILSKTQDRSSSSRSQAHLTKLQRKVFVPTSPLKTKYKNNASVKSKDSSVMSISSSASSRTIKSELGKDKKQSKLSKQRLAKKIEQLKAKARIESTQKRIIKLQVEKKIEKIVCQQKKPPQKVAFSPKQQITQTQQNQQNEQGYEQLLQLLKTNKTIQSPSMNLSPKSIQINHFQVDKRQKEYYQLRPDKNQKIESEKTLQSTVNLQMKSSTAIPHYLDEKRANYIQERIGSETNLLESSPSIDTPRTNRRSLKLSRCIDVRIINENNNSSQEGSGFEGLFGGNHFRSNTFQMSFEGRDNPKRRLRELEFQFDQLVRQQLISSDAREKQLLSLTIRTVLSSIAELKQKIARQGK